MTEEMIRLRISRQLENKSKLEYDLAGKRQECANIELLIEGCDINIQGLNHAKAVLADMESELAQAYAKAVAPLPKPEQPKVEYVVHQHPVAEPAPAKPKAQKAPKAAQAPKPAKRRGRPPGRKSQPKPEPIQDEPTQAGGSWNGNGGLTPEQAAAQ